MTVALAFIGAGGIASTHLDNLAEIDRADVVAVCDIDEDTARDAADPFDAAVYTDHETLYAEADFDAVFVCVPPFAHTDQELLAARNDVDLFVEKPLALDSETAHEIRDAAAEAGLVSQVGHMNRYADIVERATELVSERTIALLDGRWIGTVPGADWWGVQAESGGQIVEQSTHLFDLIRYFGGDVETVRATGSQRVITDAIDFDDASSATITHQNGLVSHVFTSCASPEYEITLRLVGDGFELTLDFTENTLTGRVDDEPIEYAGETDAYRTELEAYLDALEADDPELPRSPYADATKTFDLTLAATEALETDETVSLETPAPIAGTTASRE